MLSFRLKTDFITLAQLLKAADLCASGGEAGRYIDEGEVKVGGQVETRRGRKIRAGQAVEFRDEKIVVE